MDANQLPVSPTGEPMFSQPILKVLAIVFGIASIVLLIIGKSHPGIEWITDARDIVFEVGLFLGIVSPGWRKATPALVFLLVIVASSQLVACTAAQQAKAGEISERIVVRCLVSPAPAAMGEVVGALEQDGMRWSSSMDNLSKTKGMEFVVCALAELIRAFEDGAGEGPYRYLPRTGSVLPPVVVLSRAYSYLDARRLDVVGPLAVNPALHGATP